VNGVFVRCGILAVPTGEAMARAKDFYEPSFGQIAERVEAEVDSYLFSGVICRDELARVREVDAVIAGMHVRRTADEEVHFASASLADFFYSGTACRTADNGIVYDDYALALHQTWYEVQLEVDRKVASSL